MLPVPELELGDAYELLADDPEENEVLAGKETEDEDPAVGDPDEENPDEKEPEDEEPEEEIPE